MILIAAHSAGVMSLVGLGVLSAAVLLLCIRLAAGPSLADRVLALDMIGNVLTAMFVLTAVVTDQAEYIAVGALLALINFLGTIAFASFLYRRTMP